jgi:hypothetical protein
MLNSKSVIYVYIDNDGLKLTSTWSGTRGVSDFDDQNWNWLVPWVVLETLVNLMTGTEID